MYKYKVKIWSPSRLKTVTHSGKKAAKVHQGTFIHDLGLVSLQLGLFLTKLEHWKVQILKVFDTSLLDRGLNVLFGTHRKVSILRARDYRSRYGLNLDCRLLLI